MIGGGLARVVGEAALLRDDRVGAGRQDDVAAQALLLEDLVGLVGDDVSAGDVDAEGAVPTCSSSMWPVLSGGTKMPAVTIDGVEAAVGEHDVLEHAARRLRGR